MVMPCSRSASSPSVRSDRSMSSCPRLLDARATAASWSCKIARVSCSSRPISVLLPSSTLPAVIKRSTPRSPTAGALRSISDRKSTRLNSSHSQISYAVFCLKKKEDTKERRLAGAVASEEAEDLALVDREGNAFEGFRPSRIRFPQCFDADDLHGPRPTGACYLRLLRGPPRQLPPGGRNAARPERNGPMSHCEPYVPKAYSPDSVPRFVDRTAHDVVIVGGGPAGVGAAARG